MPRALRARSRRWRSPIAAGRRRSRPGADLGRRSANWIAPARRPVAAREAGADARAARLRRLDRRDQCGAQASLAHQGRTACRRVRPARLVTVAISDVPGDDPAVIGSGPTVPDPTTLADARATIARYRLDVPDAVAPRARRSRQRNAEAGRPDLRRYDLRAAPCAAELLSARSRRPCRRPATSASCLAPTSKARPGRSPPRMRGGRCALKEQGRRAVILSGGELTVTLRGQGRGGPNQEYALALALALDGAPGSPRSPPIPTAPTAAAGSPTTPPAPSSTRHDGPGPGPWPRSGRLSCRQQFDRILPATRRPADAGTDLYQRQ